MFLSIRLPPREHFYTSENSYSLYLEFLKSNKDDVIAIGEVGLDYKKVISKEEVRKQKEVFLKFIQLSDKYQKPLVIHCRAATEDTVDILLKQGVHGAIMHAFPGSLSQALRLIKNNNYISIPTSIVYSPQKVQIAQGVPLTHLLIETDSPVMSPFKNIRRNEPAFLIKAAEKIAEIKGVSLEKVTEETFNNSIRAYNLILR
ncbi:D-aminoacyl-tRNA deacylase [archaeon HR06]|nr:D-aminoacyl-tRNA deacylase [archaeon HR06]